MAALYRKYRPQTFAEVVGQEAVVRTLSNAMATVRSRCQTFVFQRPRLQDLVKKLRVIADAEGIEVADPALALVARGARGAYRDAESALDQLASSTGNNVTVQAVLELLG